MICVSEGLMKKIFVTLGIMIFASFAFAQTPVEDPKKRFLSAPKHYDKVAKDTKKLEKSLTTPRIKPVKTPTVKKTPPPEPQLTPPPAEEQPGDEQTEEAAAEAPAPEQTIPAPVPDEKTNWLLSVNVIGEIQLIHAKDQFTRTLRLVSSPGIGGRVTLGYMLSDNFGIIGNYAIDKIVYGNFDTYVVTQDHGYGMAGKIGARIRFADSFSVDALVGLEQNYTVYLPSTSTITVTRFSHGAITLALNYAFYTGDKFMFSGKTELETYLPVSNSAWQTALGLGASTELRLGVPIGTTSSFYFNVGGAYADLKQTIAKQYGVTIFAGAGFILAN
jgi:hypothetical protein